MKKFLIPLLSLLLFLPLPAFAQEAINICINDYYIESDAEPFVEKNRVLVPIRVISENMGALVDWIPKSQTVKIRIQPTGPYTAKKTLELKINQKTVKIKNQGQKTSTHTMDVPAKVVNNRTFVPIRFVAEVMGKPVAWDQANRTVVIGDSYQPLQIKDDFQIHWKDQSFPLRALNAKNTSYISIQDFAKAMNWSYRIDRENYSFGGSNDLGLILSQKESGKKVVFHGRGIESDGIYLNLPDTPYSYLYYNRDYYIPLKEMAAGLHWTVSENKEENQAFLEENQEETSYKLSFKVYDASAPDMYRFVPAKNHSFVYKNNHFLLMPQNKIVTDYLDEIYAQPLKDPFRDLQTESRLYGCNHYSLNEKEKTIVGFMAD